MILILHVLHVYYLQLNHVHKVLHRHQDDQNLKEEDLARVQVQRYALNNQNINQVGPRHQHQRKQAQPLRVVAHLKIIDLGLDLVVHRVNQVVIRFLHLPVLVVGRDDAHHDDEGVDNLKVLEAIPEILEQYAILHLLVRSGVHGDDLLRLETLLPCLAAGHH